VCRPAAKCSASSKDSGRSAASRIGSRSPCRCSPWGRPEVRGWWLRTWDRSYRELEIGEIASAEELREVAHDVGAQLGSTNLVEGSAAVNRQKRMVEIEGLARFVPRIRQVAHELTAAVLEAWEQFRKG
jgi:hypothetical protein